MNDDVERFYTNPIPNGRRSRWLSGLMREVFGGAFRYRIGIGFEGIVVQNLIVCRLDPIPVLYQIASLKVAPVWSILKIWMKMALPCGASSKF